MEEGAASKSTRMLQRRTDLVAEQDIIAVVDGVDVPVAVRSGVEQKESVIGVEFQATL